ncbi:MAG: hypothetical protein AMXMBFR13_10150 [Phycisphaerae bacterium]
MAGAQLAPEITLQPLVVIGAKRRRPQPQIPLEVLRDRLFALGRLLAIRATGTVPDMHLPDLAKGSIADQFEGPAEWHDWSVPSGLVACYWLSTDPVLIHGRHLQS